MRNRKSRTGEDFFNNIGSDKALPYDDNLDPVRLYGHMNRDAFLNTCGIVPHPTGSRMRRYLKLFIWRCKALQVLNDEGVMALTPHMTARFGSISVMEPVTAHCNLKMVVMELQERLMEFITHSKHAQAWGDQALEFRKQQRQDHSPKLKRTGIPLKFIPTEAA